MSNKREFDNFDEFAASYRNKHDESLGLSGTNSHFFSEFKIFQLLKHEKCSQALRILDFGCGDGNSSVYIRKHFPNASIFGIDVSQESIDIASKKKIKNSEFCSFDGETLPYSEGAFDLVFTSMVFHHIDHDRHKEIVREIYRVTKSGGRFYNFEHNPYNPLTNKVVRDCEFDQDAVLLKPGYHRKMTESQGFSIDKLAYIFFVPRHRLLNALVPLESFFEWCPIGAQYYVKAIK